MLFNDYLRTLSYHDRKIIELKLQKIQCDLMIDHYKQAKLGNIKAYAC